VFTFGSEKYAVVEFLSEEGESTVSLISSSWLVGRNECYWPNEANQRKLALNHAAVKSNWILYPCNVLGTSGEINIVCWIAEMFTMTSHELEFVILMMISLESRPTCCHATLALE
jgi:hypothetical protein